MYLPRHFEETRVDVLHALIKTHPFATLVALIDAELVVNHIPLVIYSEGSEFGTLRGHVARANPLWRGLSDAAEAVAVFQGPHTYISPSWYPSKQVDGKSVPTWNYAVAHAHGRPRVVEDAHWLLRHLTDMTNQQEAGLPQPWQVGDAPGDYLERMMGAIVGIEIPISKIAGKWKVSQNRVMDDRLGVVAGLESQADDQSRAMAELVKSRINLQ